jgi:hypothetical protein
MSGDKGIKFATQEEMQAKAREYMSQETAQAAMRKIAEDAEKKKGPRGAFMSDTRSEEDQARIDRVDAMPPTWRTNLPVFGRLEYWQRRADSFPYIKRSDEMDNFFLRGITVHPRLSDYPQCKDVIRDYFTCRDRHKVLVLVNICAPVKEQMSACLNEVFVKRCETANKKSIAKRHEAQDSHLEKKFARYDDNRTKLTERSTNFQD